jgi:hypothetical protein
MKVLVPVFPSERFYDAVVAAGDLVANEGGVVTFLFTELRPPESRYLDDPDGRPSEIDVTEEAAEVSPAELESWRERQVEALDDARALLADRGVRDDRIDYAFAEQADHGTAAQAIADEAAAGAYDLVILSRGYMEDEVSEEGSPAEEVAEAIQGIGGDVRLLVT